MSFHFGFRLRMTFFWMIFITLMLPVEVRILPTYKVAADLKILDSYAGLDPPAGSPRPRRPFCSGSSLMTIPDELCEAHRIDGGSPMQFFFDILVPMSRTSIAALFVILFIYGWNQYLWPLLDHEPTRATTRC